MTWSCTTMVALSQMALSEGQRIAGSARSAQITWELSNALCLRMLLVGQKMLIECRHLCIAQLS
jgi:hypothetical protein